MKTQRNVPVRSALAIALALAFPAGYAIADEVKELSSPDVSQASIGVRGLDKANPYYLLYSDMDRAGVKGGLDFNVIKRDEDGVWAKIQARNLGLRQTEFGASVEKQGDWRLGLDYNDISKFAPYTINTKVSGVGTANLVLNPDFRSYLGPGPESTLTLERKGTTLSGNKFISDAFKFNFSLRTEDKNGAIMSSAYGANWANPVGSPNPTKTYGAQFFVPQVENYRHNQFEASLDYFTRKFQLTGGVYLSVLDNANTAMNVMPGQNSLTTTAGPITSPWISLPPSNRATQWDLSGAYNFSDLTRLSFKASRENATQDAAFIPAYGTVTPASGTPVSPTYTSLNPPGVPYASGITNTSLNGLVETTAYFAQLTSKLSTNLNMLFSWRYENRDDETPQRYYLDSNASTEFPNGTQNPLESHTINRGKFELGYRLPAGYSLLGGLDYDRKETPDAYRDSVTDQTVRAEVRKALDETLNGRILLAHSERTGGDWHLLDGTPNPPAVTFSTTTGVAAPLQFVDRNRDKAKFMMDWAPTDPLSFQFFYEYGKDDYNFTPPSGNAQMGMTKGETQLFGLDASYRIGDNWKLNGFYSYNQNKTHQNEMYTPRPGSGNNACTGTTIATYSCSPWQADLNMTGEVLGIGATGSMSRWIVGAQYLYSVDRTKYGITFDPYLYGAGNSVPAGAGVLPDTLYSINRLKLSGTYSFTKATRVRLDYVYDLRTVDDYTWAQWTFTDGTKVNVSPTQASQLLGATLVHSF